MKILELLHEAREDFIASSMGNRLMQVYQNDTSLNKPKISDATNLVYFISKNTNPKYIQWIAKQYAIGNFKLEDLSKVREEISEFNRVKQKLEFKDINQYQSLSQLYQTLQPFKQQEVKSGKQKSREQYQQLFQSGEAEYVYKGRTLDVVIPHTEKASCELGKGTRWCTAATKSENMFSMYSDEGLLYIIRTRDGHKFQFQFETEQFMNEMDEEVDVSELTKRYPELKDAFDAVATKHLFLPLIKNPTPKIALAAVKENGLALKYVEHQTPNIALAAVKENGLALEYVEHQTPKIALAAVKKSGWALEYVEYQTPKIALAAVKEVGGALYYVKNPTPEIMLAAVRQSPHALKVITDQKIKQQIAKKLGLDADEYPSISR